VRDFLYVLGVALLVAPIAAQFLFGNHEKGCLPLEDQQQEEVTYP
jgi:hypothetical protein